MGRSSSSSMKAAKPANTTMETSWDDVFKASSTHTEPSQQLAHGHYKVCNRCHQKKSVESFEGRKRCKECREHVLKNWNKLMARYSAAGVGQRIPLTELERMKMSRFFDDACAFCGCRDEKRIRMTRLIPPNHLPGKVNGGDELWNIIPACTSCIQSRKGWGANWEDWMKTDPELYAGGYRHAVILAWHNEKPKPPLPNLQKRNSWGK